MKPRSFMVFLAVALAANGCSKMERSTEMQSGDAAAEVTPVANAAITPDLYSNGFGKLIKTADYRFEAENVHKSIADIEVAIRTNNAFISSSNLEIRGNMLESKMTIRVNNENFENLLKDIDQQAKSADFRNIKTEDVSKQFVDLESRLRTKREVEQRYMEILRKKAGTIEELLKAEQQIGELHEEIEATISRINYLKDEVRYSTINLAIYQTIAPVVAASQQPGTLDEMKEALISGWQGFVTVFTAILYLWPLAVVGTSGAILYRSLKKRRIRFATTHFKESKL
jgi:hypothetical protein